MELFERFYQAGNEENAVEMAAYMKNRFPFLGIQKPKRAELSKEFLKASKKSQGIDWDFVSACYDKPEREFHYLAISYLQTVMKRLQPQDITRIEGLIVTNSWWDSVDSLDEVVGHLCLQHPQLKEAVVSTWIDSSNIWLKRVAINFQLKYKENTDTEFLSKAILRNSDSNEFFVNKAIGWSLREYSKTDKEWVKAFLEKNKLSPLSVREAGKYL